MATLNPPLIHTLCHITDTVTKFLEQVPRQSVQTRIKEKILTRCSLAHAIPVIRTVQTKRYCYLITFPHSLRHTQHINHTVGRASIFPVDTSLCSVSLAIGSQLLPPQHQHSVVCLTTGSQPLPQRVLHREGSSTSSFNFKYPLVSFK